MSIPYNRIAITGPESSGKTTLANQLHQKLGGTLIGEYARRYLEKTGGKYDKDDLDAIALGQMRQWIPAHVHPFICDTEMTTMKIWSLEKFGKLSPLIEMLCDQQRFDIYLLCRPDIPWEDDPMRESPKDRERLFDIYAKMLTAAGRPYHIIEGQDRLNLALSILSK